LPGCSTASPPRRSRCEGDLRAHLTTPVPRTAEAGTPLELLAARRAITVRRAVA
jgi:hypothetical protein